MIPTPAPERPNPTKSRSLRKKSAAAPGDVNTRVRSAGSLDISDVADSARAPENPDRGIGIDSHVASLVCDGQSVHQMMDGRGDRPAVLDHHHIGRFTEEANALVAVLPHPTGMESPRFAFTARSLEREGCTTGYTFNGELGGQVGILARPVLWY